MRQTATNYNTRKQADIPGKVMFGKSVGEVSVKEAAALLNVSRSTFYRYMADGLIDEGEARLVMNRRYFPVAYILKKKKDGIFRP